jgi:hypothetical protein
MQVTRNGGKAALESRDGKALYYAKDPYALWRKELPDGKETQIATPIYRYNFALRREWHLLHHVRWQVARDCFSRVKLWPRTGRSLRREIRYWPCSKTTILFHSINSP